MPFQIIQGLKIFRFDIFDQSPIIQAVFTRHGGVSQTPWDTLNFGSTVGDAPQHVAENHRRALGIFGYQKQDIYDVWLVHGSDIVCANEPRPEAVPHEKADIILTDQPGLPLFMRYADCVPIMLYDRRRHIAGIVHSGWQGTVKQTVRNAVRGMEQRYGSVPADIAAAIGPSICPDHYEVGSDVVEMVRTVFGEAARNFLVQTNGSVNLDLWQANEWLLMEAGVREIENPRLCTACSNQDWYSHRKEAGKTGRFGAIICLAG